MGLELLILLIAILAGIDTSLAFLPSSLPTSPRTSDNMIMAAENHNQMKSYGRYAMAVVLPTLLGGGSLSQLPSSWIAATPATATESKMLPSTTVNIRTVIMTSANVLESTCLGFGCGSYQGADFAGLTKEEVGSEPSISFQDFLQAIEKKQVKKVELLGPNGDKAYATLAMASSEGAGGVGSEQRVRVGEGFPVENSKAWSSPLWVVRILKDKNIPYTLGYDLKGVATTAKKPPGKLY